jgi:hypothetical protein
MTKPYFLNFDDYLFFEQLEFHSPKVIFNKFDWNWPAGSGGEDLFKIVIVF